jgi:hypothetical protein
MMTVRYEFVDIIPDRLEEGMVYISVHRATALHKCLCGCGNEVVTPISPEDWKLIFDGETISLYPSIGNWNFDCKSHYWITNNKVHWAEKWRAKRIKKSKFAEKKRKKLFEKWNFLFKEKK